ncbi:hypothetical protein R5R35_004822 [Gryllus longicercus]|uniref:RING-type E3 ubiquitin transferase n=1 Tax=Gryllus longicercus TaxID=2509291 RepID=A0AAN9VNV8_9ORTH
MTAELSLQEVLQPTTSVQGAAARAAEVKSEATEAVVEAGSVARAVACPGPTLPPRARSRSLSPHAPVPGRRQSYAKFGRLLLDAFQPSASQQSAGAGGGAVAVAGAKAEAAPALPPRALSRSPSPAAAAAAAPQERQDEMLRLLECPVCMEHMFPPIEQCVNGHSVCARCRLCVSECPECKGRFAGTRCRRLEAICEVLLPRPCRHSTLGCRERLFADALPQHEAACGFRPSRCALCKQRMAVQDLRPHLGLRHSGNVLEPAVERSVHNDTPKAFSMYLTEAHGHYFWLWKRNGLRDVCMGVGHAVEDDSPPEFLCTLKATSADGSCELSFSGPVHSAAEHETSLAPCGKCLILHRAFMKEGAKYSVHITAKDMDKID